MKYVEKYGDSEEAAKRFFGDRNDISCEMCNTTCTWEDVYVYVDENGYYLCEDCAMEEEQE